MTRRKLTKKDFEQMLNEKGDALALLEGMDLSGLDDYYESWKAQRKAAPHQIINHCRPELATKRDCNPPQFGTWLRAKPRDPGDPLSYGLGIPEFDRRYENWVETHA
jgi:hypothetical protein